MRGLHVHSIVCETVGNHIVPSLSMDVDVNSDPLNINDQEEIEHREG